MAHNPSTGRILDSTDPAGPADQQDSDMLAERFQSLWTRCLREGTDSNAEQAWSEIYQAYTEPHRKYHNLFHIAHCLEEFDKVKALADNADALEISIWFHDVINIPGAESNEEQSAELFTSLASDRMQQDFVNEVCRLIMATTHSNALQMNDEYIVADIDLSSIGLPWKDFLRDNSALKKENRDTPPDDYRQSKLNFLLNLLARPRIYYTDFFHERLEETARENIERYISSAESGK